LIALLQKEGSKGTIEDVLRPGSDMVAAGYTMYGSSTNLVLTTGNGVNGYTLDSALGEFILTHPDVRFASSSALTLFRFGSTLTDRRCAPLCVSQIRVPDRGKIYSFNEGNSAYFHPETREYLDSIKFPKGEGAKPYSARYIGSMVADVHRTLLYGGIFGYPGDTKTKSGKLRILYEAFREFPLPFPFPPPRPFLLFPASETDFRLLLDYPCSAMAMLMEQAGGLATTGTKRILDLVPEHIHDRTPIYLGSKKDVEDVQAVYAKKA
jgi:fructose-1,6-bisphosphatase I